MMKKLFIFFLLLFLSSLATLFYIKSTSEKLSHFPQGGEFSFVKDNRVVKLSDFKGQVTLLYFGFTFCPDICPTALMTFKGAYNELDARDRVKMLFITVDPQRDTQKKIDDYVKFFHEDIIALRSELEHTKEVAANYRVNFRKFFPDDKKDFYTIDHTTTMFLIDKKGELREVIPHNISKDELVTLIKNYL